MKESDAERELSLAEMFEPRPSVLPNIMNPAPWYSKSGWWVYVCCDPDEAVRHYNATGQPLTDPGWQPRSYREPDRVVWMLKRNWSLEISIGDKVVIRRYDALCGVQTYVADDLETALANAVAGEEGRRG